MARCEYLSRVLQDHDVNTLILQEALTTEDPAKSRSRIPRYSFITTIHQEKYRLYVYGTQATKPEEIETDLELDNNLRLTSMFENLTNVTFTNPEAQ